MCHALVSIYTFKKSTKGHQTIFYKSLEFGTECGPLELLKQQQSLESLENPTKWNICLFPKTVLVQQGTNISIPEGVSKGVPKTNDQSHLLNLRNTGVFVPHTSFCSIFVLFLLLWHNQNINLFKQRHKVIVPPLS